MPDTQPGPLERWVQENPAEIHPDCEILPVLRTYDDLMAKMAEALRKISEPSIAAEKHIDYHGQLVRWTAYTREIASAALARYEEVIRG